jgi:serine/threonine-protein kinase
MTARPKLGPEPTILPRRFGRYVLFDAIGKGGMAEIYLARAESELGGTRLCVVKQILPAFAENEEFSELLTFEAKLAARLSHGNVVQVFDLGRADGRLFIAMEYVEGWDLNGLLRECTKKQVPLPLEFALRIIGDVLRGLEHAHKCKDDDGKLLGVVHRDVSPSNVLVSLSGESKVCDFGIAHANAKVDESAVLSDDALRGKAGYMSPEQARGEDLDARSDVFAAGILLWEMLAGRRMYKAAEGVDLFTLARRGVAPELPKKGLPVEEELHAIVAKALAESPNDRFESASAMLRELEATMAKGKLLGSSLKFGTWLEETLGTKTFEERRIAERRVDAASGPIPEAAVSGPGISAGDEPEGELASSPLLFPRPSMGAMRAFKAGLEKDGVGAPKKAAGPSDASELSRDDEAAFARRPGEKNVVARLVLLAAALAIVLVGIYFLRR